MVDVLTLYLVYLYRCLVTGNYLRMVVFIIIIVTFVTQVCR
jgi:hypothetical protein